jgi:pyruvate dehydrogenase E2 component (dihydrolipoamide acetyltransferase)
MVDHVSSGRRPLVILMPKLGLTMTEGTVAEWKVRVGQEVKPGDVMFVVETDKSATDVEAESAGIVSAIHVEAGRTAAVGSAVATLIPLVDTESGPANL